MQTIVRLKALLFGVVYGIFVSSPMLASPAPDPVNFDAGTIADYDASGSLDLLVQPDTLHDTVQITLTDATSENAERVITLPADHLGLDWTSENAAIVAGDFNGDGWVDLMLQPQSPDRMGALLLATGPAEYPYIAQSIPADFLGFDWPGISSHIVAGDFNGDGRAELLLQANDPMGLFYVINTDASGRLVSHGQGWIDEYLARRWASQDTAVHVGDFDGDHRDDLLLQPISPPRADRADDATYALVPAEANGRFERVAQTWGLDEFDAEWDPKTHRLIVVDVDGDGIDDIWLHSKVGGADHLLLGSTKGIAAEHIAWKDGVSPRTDLWQQSCHHAGLRRRFGLRFEHRHRRLGSEP